MDTLQKLGRVISGLIGNGRYPVSSGIFAVLLLTPAVTFAFNINELPHNPPQAKGKEAVEIRVAADGIRDARLLVANYAGYNVVPLIREGGDFVAQVAFGDRAVLRYQFQIAADEGGFFESRSYEVRQEANPELENRVKELSLEQQRLTARAIQLENALPALKRMDPRTLAQRRTQEMAKAVVQLRETERSYTKERDALTAEKARLEQLAEPPREILHQIEEVLND